MKTAILFVAALTSACSLEIDSLDNNSSRTLIEFLFSAILPVVEGFAGVSMEGIVKKRRRRRGTKQIRKFVGSSIFKFSFSAESVGEAKEVGFFFLMTDS